MTRLYAWFTGIFLLLQGSSTLAARWWPAFDQAFPALLEQTRMVPSHSMLHIATACLALAALRWGGSKTTSHFALGFGLFYVGLAGAGIISGRDLCLGLQPFDHPFHILLGGLGLLAAGVDRLRAGGAAVRAAASANRGLAS